MYFCMKNQILTPKMIFFQLGILAIILFLSFLDSLMPARDMAADGIVVYEAWIGTAITTLGGLASSILGNQQARRQTKLLDEAQANLEDWRNGIVNTNTLDRADSMSMLKAYRDILEEQSKKNNTAAIKGGLSDEAQVAQATATNKGMADAISRIAGYGQQQKDRAEQTYQAKLHDYNMRRAALAGAGAQTTADAISGATSTIGNLLTGFDWGSLKKKKEDEGGSNQQ
jgi:hypothetical protein